jgi:hypothetical protein
MKRLGFWGTLGFALEVASSLATAHDLPVNRMMNAFVKIEPTRAQLVVRVPLDLMRGIPFPLKGADYDLAAAAPATELALIFLADGFVILENGVRLAPSSSAGRLSPPSDRSFEDYDTAMALADRPPEPAATIPYDKGYLDVHFTYPISSPKSVFKIQTQIAADLGSVALLTVRYLPLGESSRAMIISGGAEPAALNPAWYHAAGSFVVLGIEHILSGIDHLLFLFCLVIPFQRLRGLIAVITAFTVAHSVTLFASAFHLVPKGAWFPPFVEVAIACSIVWMALENMVGVDLARRWRITGLFGLVHGFGFSNALGQSLQFAGSHLLLSLFSFNVGIEIGQLCVLAVMLPALILMRRVVPARLLVLVLSGAAAAVGANWMWERWQVLRQVQWPGSGGTGVGALAWGALGLIACVGGWVLARWSGRKLKTRAEPKGGPRQSPTLRRHQRS